MNYSFEDFVDDLLALKGRPIAPLTAHSDPYTLKNVLRDGSINVGVVGSPDVDISWPSEKVEGIFRIMSAGYACHVDAFLQGSGSRRSSLRDTIANTPHVFFTKVDGKTCVTLSEDHKHDPGSLEWLDNDGSIELWRGGQTLPAAPVENEPAIKSNQPDAATKAIVLFGPSGTGKTYTAIGMAADFLHGSPIDERLKQREIFTSAVSDERAAIVTFHQSYSYEDFVEGIFPSLKDGVLTYEVRDGLLKELAKRASQEPSERFALIIDEMNRGNTAKIFGELITLLEDNRRIGSEEETSVSLQYTRERFCLPQNLLIIGTMNTSDRSLARIDYALRRRFEFIEIEPDPKLLGQIDADGDAIDLGLLLTGLNRRITELAGREKRLGHSHFMRVQRPEDLKAVFRRKIIPLLEEYFIDDVSSLAYVLSGQNDDGDSSLVRSVGDEATQGATHYELDLESLDEISTFKAMYGDEVP